MEQKYWEQFMKTGGVTDYLDYKMEMYGHCRQENKAEKSGESAGTANRRDVGESAGEVKWR